MGQIRMIRKVYKVSWLAEMPETQNLITVKKEQEKKIFLHHIFGISFEG